MINGNIISFGYGDIAVGYNSLRARISFQQFKPPAECGNKIDNVDNVEFIGKEIVLNISYEDYVKFNEQLQKIENKETTSFKFKGYIFDFDNFNNKSINVCKRCSFNAIFPYLMCCAV